MLSVGVYDSHHSPFAVCYYSQFDQELSLYEIDLVVRASLSLSGKSEAHSRSELPRCRTSCCSSHHALVFRANPTLEAPGGRSPPTSSIVPRMISDTQYHE